MLFNALRSAPNSRTAALRALFVAHTDEEGQSDKAPPEFVRYLAPILEVLQAMGGQGRAAEVLVAVTDRLDNNQTRERPSPTRSNRLRRHIYRARHYLLRAGLLTTEQHGVWQLTAHGRSTALADGDAMQLYEEIEYQQQLTASLETAGETVRRLAETPVPYSVEAAAMPPALSTAPTRSSLSLATQPYPLSAVAAVTFLAEEQLARWVQAIERKGQVIFYGPPGVGKTFLAEQLARHLAGGVEEDAGTGGFVETVQFHAAYAYEDFVQGMRPQAGTRWSIDLSGGAGAFSYLL
ncbi:MAG: winged helix-turn-helix domain-containing protein [Caldilineaceae bacterium]